MVETLHQGFYIHTHTHTFRCAAGLDLCFTLMCVCVSGEAAAAGQPTGRGNAGQRRGAQQGSGEADRG